MKGQLVTLMKTEPFTLTAANNTRHAIHSPTINTAFISSKNIHLSLYFLKPSYLLSQFISTHTYTAITHNIRMGRTREVYRRSNIIDPAYSILDELFELAENEELVEQATRQKIRSCARRLEYHIRTTGRTSLQEGNDKVMSSDQRTSSTLEAEMERHKAEILSAMSTKIDESAAQIRQEVQKLSSTIQAEQNLRFTELLREIRHEFHPKQPIVPPARMLKRKRQETDTQTNAREALEAALKEK